MNPQTLYITFDGLSDPLGQSQILPYLTGLSPDFDITILSCEKPNRLEKEKSAITDRLSQNNISWRYIAYEEDGGTLSRVKNVLIVLREAKKLYSKQKFKLIHARSYLAALVALSLKRKFGVPFIFDMRGFWADERIDGNIWNKKNLLHLMFFKYFKKKETSFLAEASAIVSLTETGRSHLEKQFPSVSINSKTEVIPCCVNVEAFDPEHVSKKYIEGISENDHVLIYTGSIGTWYYTREMLDCFSVWHEKINNLKLLIITRDIHEANEILKSYPREIKKAVHVSSASFAEIPSYLAIAKAAIFFIKPAFSKIASSPTKMAECWAMNLPIITNSGIGDNDLYFKQKKGGVLINNFTRDEYEKGMDAYLNVLSSGINFRQIAMNYFNTRNAITSYKKIYLKITNNKQA